MRIAVAVDAAGRYKATGWGGAVDWVAEERAAESLKRFGEPVEVRWFEADVPLPLPPQTVQGSVTPAEERVSDEANQTSVPRDIWDSASAYALPASLSAKVAI